MSSPAFPLVDVRAARLAQALTAVLVALAVGTRAWPLLALPLAHVAASAALGRRGNLAVRAFERLLAPRLGPGRLEDARPPRFANAVGTLFLTASIAAHAIALPRAGWALAGVVGALAALGAATGFCAGCETYRLLAIARGVRTRAPARIELADVGATAPGAGLVVQFTHPLCGACHALEADLAGAGATVVRVDVSRRPDLARKYGIAAVPVAYAVAADGRITARLA